MLLRTIAIAVVLSGTVTCGDELLDLGEDEMRVIASQLRSVVRGAAQCKEIARQTAHARVHMSPAELDRLSQPACLSMPNELVCRAEQCTCRSDGGTNNDGDYRVNCTHTKDGRTTSKEFEFSDEAIVTFAAQTDEADGDETSASPEPSARPQPTAPSPTAEDASSICAQDEAETLRYSELVLELASEAPLFVSDMPLGGLSCSSEESGTQRIARCEGANCACEATFELNSVPTQASCEGL